MSRMSQRSDPVGSRVLILGEGISLVSQWVMGESMALMWVNVFIGESADESLSQLLDPVSQY